jgi:fatty acid-binding protein DegV
LEILAKRVAEYYPREKTIFSRVNSVIGAHVGPHVLLMSFIEGK